MADCGIQTIQVSSLKSVVATRFGFTVTSRVRIFVIKVPIFLFYDAKLTLRKCEIVILHIPSGNANIDE